MDFTKVFSKIFELFFTALGRRAVKPSVSITVGTRLRRSQPKLGKDIGRFILFYNSRRPHYSIGLQTPDAVHGQTGEQKKMWKNKIYRRNEQGLQANP